LELLQDPQLVDRILADFDTCGVVGETLAKLTGYLAATSRQLPKPLGLVLQSSSAAGKSSLLDAVLDFMPEERVYSCTRHSGSLLRVVPGKASTRCQLDLVQVENRASHFRVVDCVSWQKSRLEMSVLAARTGSVERECQNRSCPKCGGGKRLRWYNNRLNEMLPVEYYHVVFTVPRPIAKLAAANPRVVYDVLFHSVSFVAQQN